jgi:hypothetical protein
MHAHRDCAECGDPILPEQEARQEGVNGTAKHFHADCYALYLEDDTMERTATIARTIN